MKKILEFILTVPSITIMILGLIIAAVGVIIDQINPKYFENETHFGCLLVILVVVPLLGGFFTWLRNN